jgi:hypothetical protein
MAYCQEEKVGTVAYFGGRRGWHQQVSRTNKNQHKNVFSIFFKNLIID